VTPSIPLFFTRRLIKHSFIVLLSMAAMALFCAFFLARYNMSQDLKKSAQGLKEGFRSRILDGDINNVESQLIEVLKIEKNERVKILSPNLEPIYRSQGTATGDFKKEISSCSGQNEVCFDGSFVNGKIFVPIFFDQEEKSLFGYLYIQKRLSFDWLYVFSVVFIFVLGSLALLSGFFHVAKMSSQELASEMKSWADRLSQDPKNQAPLTGIPFSELFPLKSAIEGLNRKIRDYEEKAGDQARLLTLRGIAHDLLTPVSQVQLYVASLERKYQFQGEEDILGEMKASLRKLASVASQVKTFESQKKGEALLEGSEFLEILKEEIAGQNASLTIHEKNIALRFENLVDLENLKIPFSRVDLSRVLQNLIENAAHASKSKGSILLTVFESEQSLSLSIEDFGIGIPEEALDRIFEPEFTSKGKFGTGLGLYVVKNICDQSQVKIKIKAQVNQGTKVTLSWPKEISGGNQYAV